MLEVVAEFDDVLMEKFFDDPSTITEDEIKAAIRKGTISMQINPMICGSSFKNKGIQTMLDAVCAYLPSPLDTPEIIGQDVDDAEKQVVRHPDAKEPLCALAFKIATDPYVGRLCFFRVYSGKIDAGSYVYNTRSGKKERISRIFQMHSNKQNPVDVISAGDIGAGVGFKDIRTGDTLCDEREEHRTCTICCSIRRSVVLSMLFITVSHSIIILFPIGILWLRGLCCLPSFLWKLEDSTSVFTILKSFSWSYCFVLQSCCRCAVLNLQYICFRHSRLSCIWQYL